MCLPCLWSTPVTVVHSSLFDAYINEHGGEFKALTVAKSHPNEKKKLDESKKSSGVFIYYYLCADRCINFKFYSRRECLAKHPAKVINNPNSLIPDMYFIKTLPKLKSAFVFVAYSP